MVERDVILSKLAALDHGLGRVAQARGARAATLLPIEIEEIVLLNLQRSVQAVIDIAAHVVATEGFGLPSTLAETFTLLEKNGIIGAALAQRMRKMVGFRNIAVHQYDAVDPAIVEAIVTKHLGDLREFARSIVERFQLGQGPEKTRSETT